LEKNNLSVVKSQLVELEIEHRDLDHSIDALVQSVYIDQLQMQRMKKRKLRLKDQIAHLKSELIPDMDA
jgi:hypothetical protein